MVTPVKGKNKRGSVPDPPESEKPKAKRVSGEIKEEKKDNTSKAKHSEKETLVVDDDDSGEETPTDSANTTPVAVLSSPKCNSLVTNDTRKFIDEQRDIMWDPEKRTEKKKAEPTLTQRVRMVFNDYPTVRLPEGNGPEYEHILHIFPLPCGCVAIIGMNKYGNNCFYGSVVSKHFNRSDRVAIDYNIRFVKNLRDETNEHAYTVIEKSKTNGSTFREHTRVFLFTPMDKTMSEMSRKPKNLDMYGNRLAARMTLLVMESNPAYNRNGKQIPNRFGYVVHDNLSEESESQPITLGDLLTVKDAGEVIMYMNNATSLHDLALPKYKDNLKLFFGFSDDNKIDRIRDIFSGNGGGHADGFVPSSLQANQHGRWLDEGEQDNKNLWS